MQRFLLDERSFRRSLLWSVLLPLLLVAVLAGVLLWQVGALLEANRWVEHTSNVIGALNRTERLLVDGETGLRGYLLTGERRFLEPHERSRTTLGGQFSTLASLVVDNREQSERVNRLRTRAESWQLYARGRLTASGAQRANLQANLEGKRRMDELRTLIQQMLSVEENLRAIRTSTAQSTASGTILLALVALGTAGVILVVFVRARLVQLDDEYRKLLKQTRSQTEELAKREERFRRVVESNIVGILFADLEGQIHEANDAFLQTVGYSREELARGQLRWDRITPGEYTPADARAVAQLRQSGRCEVFEKAYVRKDGAQVQVLVGAALLPDSDSDEAVSFVVDVSERVRAEVQLRQLAETLEEKVEARTDQLQQANRELEQYAFVVAHDLRAPLRSIQGFVEAIVEDCGRTLNGECREYLERIDFSGRRMEQLIDDLLAYSRLGSTEIETRAISLEAAVSRALEELSADIQRSSAVIRVERPLPAVQADRVILVQVLTNLLSNAIKFVAPSVTPRVRVYARQNTSQARVRLWVEDNGIGIAPDRQERIWGVFERLHGFETYPGTGIGLAIVQRGCERMGGRAGVESQKDSGSRFFIDLAEG
ncbi:sensor histidine kinase [Gloeobacter kilaueensis]|uniref:histidine kinase n=1 Tax=Gloeobacter kilaueensis (strain ATCC BAA-2537 / CCAP 1431/1 / ULC 316 / JS1) TaxID=1183438 RepID=U5QG84_GLOK1|nr:CHASE3 domain-containing protein [Gloeobacter kilaueensis]AGY56685.1 multi-sensor signal transduction histidine kinase [Gloeobacter kilaueensis JS1]